MGSGQIWPDPQFIHQQLQDQANIYALMHNLLVIPNLFAQIFLRAILLVLMIAIRRSRMSLSRINNKYKTRSKNKNNIKKDKQHVHQGYDKALKSLFSHPIMMEYLIKGFVPQAWTKDLDFSSLKSHNVKQITEDLRTREDDIIWGIEFRGKPLYIVCLLEFQSDIDRFMSVRLLTYVGLIYQDLLKKKEKTLIEDNYLPPVFSLVFYTGRTPWNAPTSLKDCLSPMIPPSLAQYQPNIKYMTLDVGQIALEEYNLTSNNLVSSFIELETASDTTNIRLVIDKLISRLKGPELSGVRRAFLVYINRVWKSRERFPKKEFESLDEVSNMLSERIDEWEQEYIQIGEKQVAHRERLGISLKLLDHKFPKAPAVLKSKFEKCSSEQLALLIDKILDAQSLEELLAIEGLEA